MKNVTLIFVLLLMVNCTADSSDVLDIQDDLSPVAYSCVDDLPQVKFTNNGTLSFDFAVYALDYSELHSENLTTSAESDWLDLSSDVVIIVASNDDIDGQKIQLNILPCESIELEVDENNILLISGE